MNKLVSFVFGSALLLGSMQAGAAVIGIQGPDSVTLGETFDVTISISGLESTELAGFDLDMAFDDSVLEFVGYSLGSALIDPFFGQEDWSQGEYLPGTVNLAELSWLLDFSAQPDAFVLGTLSFTASALGFSPLELTYVDLTDGLADAVSFQVDLNDGVSVVPAPSSLFLLMPMLGMLAWRKRSV